MYQWKPERDNQITYLNHVNQCFYLFLWIFKCSLSGNHPFEQTHRKNGWPSIWEDLAKSGYRSDVKYIILINLLYLWLHTLTDWKPNIQIWQSLLFLVSHLWWLKKPSKFTLLPNFWFWVKFFHLYKRADVNINFNMREEVFVLFLSDFVWVVSYTYTLHHKTHIQMYTTQWKVFHGDKDMRHNLLARFCCLMLYFEPSSLEMP